MPQQGEPRLTRQEHSQRMNTFVPAGIQDISADQWTAGATVVTAVVAAVAAIVAGRVGIRQLGEARELRKAQAAPYVVAYAEPSAASSVFMELVVKNLGTTAAHDVRVVIDPQPMRAAGGGEPRSVLLPDLIPVLVPGQEYRTFWDSGIRRKDSGLPDGHEAVVSFSDTWGERLPPLRYVLDWGPLWDRDVLTVRGMHDAAEALREIRRHMMGWSESGAGLAVVMRDGDAKDERDHRRYAERLAARQQHGHVDSSVKPTNPEDDA
jgi:hypothetical protein